MNQQPTLLYMHRDPAQARAISKKLAEHLPALRVVAAHDTEETLARAGRLQPDLIAIDEGEPGVDPLEVCRRLRTEIPEGHFALIAMVDEHPKPAELLRGTGAPDACLVRPFSLSALVQHLALLMRLQQTRKRLSESQQRADSLAVREQRAREVAQSQHRHLFNALADALVVVEVNREAPANGRVLDANAAACHLLGYSHDQMLGLTARQIVSDKHTDAIPARISSVVAQGHELFEMALRARSGRDVPVEVHLCYCHFEGRDAVTAAARPLPARQRAETTLWERDSRYRLIAAQTGQIIYDVDLHRGTLRWIGATEQVIGYTAGELEAMGLDELVQLVHPADRQGLIARVATAIIRVSSYSIEYRLRTKAGHYRWVEEQGLVLADSEGRAERLIATAKDIQTRREDEEQRRALEAQLEHSQRLESLGVLAGGIAHDFNNILVGIIGLTDMALQDLPSNTATYSDLREVLQAAHRAKDLVAQILAFSRQTDEARTPIYLHLVVREALRLLRATIPATVEIGERIDVHSGVVLASAAQMHQLVMNYCTNAFAALPETGGRIDVELRDVDVDEQLAAHHPALHPGPYVRLIVRDNGHGMAPSVLKRIFDPFFTTKGPGKGTGMGLSVVHGIVTRHGGTVLVNSTPGVGSEFITYLPRSRGDVFRSAAREPVPVAQGHVLFVDDEDLILRFGENALRRYGYEVTVTNNGAKALEIVRQYPDLYDCVVTDHIMPKMSGLELAAALRDLRPTLPIILFTGYSESVTEKRAADAGVRKILLKPLLAEELVREIGAVLRAAPVVAE